VLTSIVLAKISSNADIQRLRGLTPPPPRVDAIQVNIKNAARRFIQAHPWRLFLQLSNFGAKAKSFWWFQQRSPAVLMDCQVPKIGCMQ